MDTSKTNIKVAIIWGLVLTFTLAWIGCLVTAAILTLV